MTPHEIIDFFKEHEYAQITQIDIFGHEQILLNNESIAEEKNKEVFNVLVSNGGERLSIIMGGEHSDEFEDGIFMYWGSQPITLHFLEQLCAHLDLF